MSRFRLLITGFEPFGSADRNPSQMLTELLPGEIHGFTLRSLTIPTVFGEAGEAILRAAEEFSPDVILCLGLAAGRDAMTPERIAVNIRDARIPDNRGFRPTGQRIVPEGPAAYFSTLPVEAMAQAIRDVQVPAAVSNSAGTYVCNDVLYTLLHRFAGTATRVGFLHVPQLPEQGEPSLTLEQMRTGLIAAIGACRNCFDLENKEDAYV